MFDDIPVVYLATGACSVAQAVLACSHHILFISHQNQSGQGWSDSSLCGGKCERGVGRRYGRRQCYDLSCYGCLRRLAFHLLQSARANCFIGKAPHWLIWWCKHDRYVSWHRQQYHQHQLVLVVPPNQSLQPWLPGYSLASIANLKVNYWCFFVLDVLSSINHSSVRFVPVSSSEAEINRLSGKAGVHPYSARGR